MVIRWIASLGRRQYWVQAFAALLIFGSGLVVGSSGTFAVLRKHLDVGPGFRSGRGDVNRFVNFLVHDWQSKYQLTDEQIGQLKPIVAQRFKTLGEIFKKADEQAQALEKPWLNKIKKIMTLEQYTQWHQDYERWHERRRGPRDRRGPDRGGRGRWGPRPQGSGPGGFPPEGGFSPPGVRSDGPPGMDAPVPIPDINKEPNRPEF